MKVFELKVNGNTLPYFRGPELVLSNDMFPDSLEVDLNNLSSFFYQNRNI